MKLTIILFACYFYGYKSNENNLRILGGREAIEGEFPYVVRVLFQESVNNTPGFFKCSCSVLTQWWTLIAAHCVLALERLLRRSKLNESRAVIEYQTLQRSETAYSKVLRMVSHHGYSMRTGVNDIGLLKTQAVFVAKYGKLSSLDYTTLNGQEVAIVGYGLINSTTVAPIHYIPHVLQAIVKDCYPARSFPALCYGVPCSTQKNVARSMCYGDSGGPTIHASGIVAVSSHGDGRGCKYTREKMLRRELYLKGYNVGTSIPTNPYIDWISSIIENK